MRRLASSVETIKWSRLGWSLQTSAWLKVLMLNDTEASDAAENDHAAAEGMEGEVRHDYAKRSPHDRSAIVFPYTHLEDALTVPQALSERGVPLSRDQIAGVLNVVPTNGSFGLRISGARTFRLIESIEGKFKLSDLGERILSSDENEARNARREAFLGIELYQKTFETFRNKNLPPRPLGLEFAFVEFGVPPKQKDKARLAFERSAQFAGFFHAGKDRLVEPIIPGASSSNGRQAHEASVGSGRMEVPIADPLPTAAQQLLIKGLLERLPHPDEKWTVNERARWLRALAVNLAMIYGAEDDSEITIAVPSPPSKAAAFIKKADEAGYVPRTREPPTSQAASAADLDDEIPF